LQYIAQLSPVYYSLATITKKKLKIFFQKQHSLITQNG